MISKRTIGWATLAALLAAAEQSPVLGKDVPAASGAEHLPSLSIRTISSLSPGTGTNASSPVRLQGTVVAQHLGEYVVINDGTGTVFADLQPVVSLKIKDVVEVVGTPVWEGSQFHLRNTSFTVTTPEAKAVTNAAEPSLARPAVLPTLTKAWQIRDLPAEKAAWKYPVQLSGVVTYFEKNYRICIQDDISGITVQIQNLNRNLNLEIGELVDVEGWSDPGAYAPIVIASKVVSRGMVPLPEPRQVTIYQLNNDQEGSQWVELTGIVHAESFTNGQITLIVSDPTGRISVSVTVTSNAPSLLDSIVRVRGISASTSNDRRQFLAAKILAPSLKFVQVEEPAIANPFDLPVRSILSLTQFRPRLTLERRVNVSGVVTFCQPGQWLYLQDATDGLQVFTTQTDGIRPGSRIKAAGYPASASYGTVLRDALCKAEAPGTLPTPDTLSESNPLNPQLHGRWVQADAHLLDSSRIGDSEILKLQFGNRVMEATCLAPGNSLQAIRAGSRIRVAGIYTILADDSRTPVSCQLLVPSSAQVTLLQSPSWWTSRHTFITLGTMGAITFAITLWVIMLRRRVREQTASLADSEMKFRSLVEQSLVGVYIIQDGHFTYANPRYCEILGYKAAEVARLNVEATIFPEDRAMVLEQLRLRLEGSVTTAHYSFRSVRKDGSVVDIEVLGSRTSYKGKPAVLGTSLDITEKKKAETALAEASSLLETLLANSPDCIYFKDHESRFVRTTASMAKLFHVSSPQDLIGKTDFDVFQNEHARAAYDDEQKIIRTGEPIIGKPEQEIHSDGRVTWALTTKLPWRDKDGNIIGTFGVSKNVTALKEAERRLAYEQGLFTTLLDNLPDSIYFKDLESRFVRVSRSEVQNAFERCRIAHQSNRPNEPMPEHLANLNSFGEHLIGRSDFDIHSEERARASFEDEQTIIRTGNPLLAKIEHERKTDGKSTWTISTKMPWRNKDGQIIGTFGVSKDITQLKEAEAQLEAAHQRLIETSRLAGMAEVATDVLHNVGNVLNSVNISCSLTIDRIRTSKMTSLAKVAALLEEHRGRLPEFFSRDPRGQQVPDYIKALAEHLQGDQTMLLDELGQLLKHIDHIKQIVVMQQSYAKVAGVKEIISPKQLVEDALHINAAALVRHDVHVKCDFQDTTPISTEKHKVLQILVNLIRNAKYAMDDAKRADKLLTLRVAPGENCVKIQVIDNGVGIPRENLTRIFAHGFTTRRNGHGFGLHSSALAVKELGGSLEAHSEGPGSGATFTLLLPLTSANQSMEPPRYESATI